MGFQLIFGNRNWENGQEKTNFLNKAKRFIFGSHIYYDPPLKRGGENTLARSTPPIWKRFYYRYLWKIYRKFEIIIKPSEQLNASCSEKRR